MRTFMMFFLAAAMAAAAGLVANNWLERQKQATEKSIVSSHQTAPVLVAAVEIPFGASLEERYVKIAQMPEDSIPETAFTKMEDIADRIAKQTVYAGEILRSERIVKRGERGGTLSAMIAPNMRALTVRVNDVIGVAGFLLPGDFVDILSSKSRSRGKKDIVTEIVLQKIKVLAVDQTASPEKDKPVIVRAVTLEVTPQQAETLVDATKEGSVQLALRNPTDDNLVLAAVPEKEPEAEAPPPVKQEAPKVVQRIIYRERPSDSVTIIKGDGKGVNVDTRKVKDE